MNFPKEVLYQFTRWDGATSDDRRNALKALCAMVSGEGVSPMINVAFAEIPELEKKQKSSMYNAKNDLMLFSKRLIDASGDGGLPYRECIRIIAKAAYWRGNRSREKLPKKIGGFLSRLKRFFWKPRSNADSYAQLILNKVERYIVKYKAQKKSGEVEDNRLTVVETLARAQNKPVEEFANTQI